MPTAIKKNDSEKQKSNLKNSFVRLLRDAVKSCPGATWTVEHWGGIRGEHPEWTHRFSPVGFVVWAETGLQPSLRDEVPAMDAKLGLDVVSYDIGEACENLDEPDAGKMTLRCKILAFI